MNRREFCGLAASTAAVLGSGAFSFPAYAEPSAGGPGFFFRDGDRVVIIGDSITEQHLHSNYVEIFTVSRFPDWNSSSGTRASAATPPPAATVARCGTCSPSIPRP